MVADRPLLLTRLNQWLVLAAAVLLGYITYTYVDLEPRVQEDFFFSSDDPQLYEQRQIYKMFGDTPQVFVAVKTPEAFSKKSLRSIHRLSLALQEIWGVIGVQSITDGPFSAEKALGMDPERLKNELLESPFWSRLLLSPDKAVSFVVLSLASWDEVEAIHAIDRVVEDFRSEDFSLGVTGVPYVSEHIRQGLSDDLRRFSSVALIIFALLIHTLFRSMAALVGMMCASLMACFLTFIVRDLVGMQVAVLTPNLWTIAFVLTISHVVYLTANYRRLCRDTSSAAALTAAVRMTGPPSFLSLLANLLGFLSLLLAPAKPLREFGISGAIAAVAAIVCAYGFYPVFLRSVVVPKEDGRLAERFLNWFFTRRHGFLSALIVGTCLWFSPWAQQVNTDPSLPSYFARGSQIRDGVLAVDLAGGSSPLELVVRNKRGGPLTEDEPVERLLALQADLEADPDVGNVVSIALLMAETKRIWYSVFFTWEFRIQQLETAAYQRIGRSFIDSDRRHGRFFLRMHETARSQSRDSIMERLEQLVEKNGFKLAYRGGLYELQGEMSKLVKDGVLRGLGGLLLLFFTIILIASRSFGISLAMLFCLSLVPFALFGLVGWLGFPLDIIAAPAANVALPMGIDEMIHLSYSLRRARARGLHSGTWETWSAALHEMWQPICASVLIVGTGFSIFMLSLFPPTQRLGVLVSLGGVLTDIVVLIVLPTLAVTQLCKAR